MTVGQPTPTLEPDDPQHVAEAGTAAPAAEAARAPAEPGAAGKSFLLHAAIYGLGSLALQAASLILTPIVTRCLTVSDYGVMEVLNRLGEVFNICLMVNGIRMAAFTFYCQAHGEGDRRRTVATVLLAQTAFLAVSGLAAMALAPLLGPRIGLHDQGLLRFGILMILADGLATVPMALMQARVESAFYVAVTAGMFCTRIGMTICLVAAWRWGVWGVLGASAATSALFGIGLTWRELRRSTFRPDWAKFREILRFVVPFMPAGLLGMVLFSCGLFVLNSQVGGDPVGLYALGYKLAWAVMMLGVGPLNQVWSARMYEAFRRPDAATYVGRVSTRILAAYLFAATGLCIFQDEAIGLVAAPRYHEAARLLGPLALAFFFWSFANLMDAPLWVFRRSGLKPAILLVSSSTTVVLCLTLIPRRGAEGAALGMLVGLAVHCAVTWLAARTVYRVRYERTRLAVMLALAVGLALAARGLGTGPVPFAEKILLWAAWPLILWGAGVVAEDEKALAIAVIGRGREWFSSRDDGQEGL